MVNMRQNKTKSSGFSLLEVVTAMAITAILLPVVGVTMYQILVVPPEQSAHLTITNELSRIAEMLYQDGYRADNFSTGVFPYYGNFSWTDYSTGLYHFISYYWTGNCTNGVINSTCNHIARAESITVVSTPTPTATITPTPTPTPTPMPTPTPTTTPTTYTFCDGGGTDKWAWGRTWSNQQWVYCGRPINISDFFVSGVNGVCVGEVAVGGYSVIDANSSIYSWVCHNDSDNWRQLDATPLEYGADTELYMIKVYQDRSLVTNLSVTWIGHGTQGVSIYHTKVRIWNYQTSAWYTLVDVTSPQSQSFQKYQRDLTTANSSNPGYYIQSGSGNVSILVSADDDSQPATQGVYTDFISLDVH